MAHKNRKRNKQKDDTIALETENEDQTSTVASAELQPNTTTSAISVQDYFKQKLEALKKGSNEKLTSDSITYNCDDPSNDSLPKKKLKKKRKAE